jgi:hypothetical protein
MRVTIEPPEGWGPARALLSELRRLGYVVEEYIVLGQRLFVIGAPPATGDQALLRRRQRRGRLLVGVAVSGQ